MPDHNEHPISVMPKRLKDGRDLFLKRDDGMWGLGRYTPGCWQFIALGDKCYRVTHYQEVSYDQEENK